MKSEWLPKVVSPLGFLKDNHMEKFYRCKNLNYVAIPTDALLDSRISLSSKGLYALIMSLPDGYDMSANSLCSLLKEQLGTVFHSALKELSDFGYCQIEQKKGSDGRSIGFTYHFHESSKNVHEEKSEETNIQLVDDKDKVAVDYNKIIECWNKHNGKSWGKVLRLTDMRRNAIQRILKTNKITETVLMRLFESLPFADKWLFNPNKEHETWKPDFDWWVKNTGGWLTKALEGRVHQENKKVFDDIMSGKEYSEYHPFCDGFLSWNDYYNCYLYIGGFYDGKIYDGYNDEDRPDGATVMLNNARGTVRWDSQTKTWDKV